MPASTSKQHKKQKGVSYMHEKIQEFINKKQEENARKKQEYKNKVLMENDLYDKEYSEHGYHSEYPAFDYEQNRYYKRVPIKCSDEDFEKLKEYLPQSEKISTNVTYGILVGIVIAIFVIGFIIGLCMYNEFTGMLPVIIIWIISFLLGISVYVYAEILRLLNIIAKK